MKKKQRIVTAGVTLLAAGVTAHMMQRGSDEPAPAAPVAPAGASAMAAHMAPAAARQPNPVIVAARVSEAAEPPAEDPEIPALQPEDPPEPETKAVALQLEDPPAPDAENPRRLTKMSVAAASVLPAPPGAEALPENESPVPATPDRDILAEMYYPDMPRPPAEAATPAPLPRSGADLQSRMATLDSAPDPAAEDASEPEIERSAFGLSCGALLTASAQPAAMVGLTLTDPCRGGETFTVEHGALVYAAELNELGTYMADIPALTAEASFTVRFEDGETVEATVEIPEAVEIDRAALITDGVSGLAIHALEFGADYEEDGHVWAGNPRDAKAAARSGGGFLTALGDASLREPRLAQVYTFPAGAEAREGVVRLSIETEVTERNCGQDVAGQTLQNSAGRLSAPVAVTLSMPDCDAIGEFLVLKNLLQDLKIASN